MTFTIKFSDAFEEFVDKNLRLDTHSQSEDNKTYLSKNRLREKAKTTWSR